MVECIIHHVLSIIAQSRRHKHKRKEGKKAAAGQRDQVVGKNVQKEKEMEGKKLRK